MRFEVVVAGGIVCLIYAISFLQVVARSWKSTREAVLKNAADPDEISATLMDQLKGLFSGNTFWDLFYTALCVGAGVFMIIAGMLWLGDWPAPDS